MLPEALTAYLLLPISILANALSFFGDHYLRNGGIVIYRQGRQATAPYTLHLLLIKVWKAITSLFTFPASMAQYSRDHSGRYGMNETSFSLFMLLNYMLPIFMHGHTTQAYVWLFGIKTVGALLCVGILFKPYWSLSMRPYFPLYYHASLFYCLPFATTFFFLLEGGNIEWLLNIGLAILLLIVLTDWALFAGLSILGIAIAIGFHQLAIGPISMHMDLYTHYALGYAVIFSTLIGLIFARRKEQEIAQEHSLLKGQGEAYQASFLQAATENRKVLQALQGSGVEKLLTMVRELQTLQVAKEDQERLQSLQSALLPMAFQLQGIDTRAQDYLRLKPASWTVPELLEAVQTKLKAHGFYARLRIQRNTKYVLFIGDAAQLATLISKSILLLQASIPKDGWEEEHSITVALDDSELSYPLPDVAQDYVKHVAALGIRITTAEEPPALQASYAPNLSSSITAVAETTDELDQLANVRITKAHYGYSEVADDTLTYIIPVDLSEVRPRDMDKAYMELGVTPERADDHFKDAKNGIDAQAQEAAFLTDVSTRSKADMSLTKEALELIKWYHGPVTRHSGEPFYLHPLAVAQIVLDYDQDEATLIGALLHDAVEDTPMQLQHVETIFGKEVAEVVDVVTHLQSIPGSIYKVKLSAAENLKMLERTGNRRGLYVKLADRTHNMRTINGHKDLNKRYLIAEETMQFFVPLAKRLGLEQTAKELEERCAEVLENKK